jgi:hypothetical protein
MNGIEMQIVQQGQLKITRDSLVWFFGEKEKKVISKFTKRYLKGCSVGCDIVVAHNKKKMIIALTFEAEKVSK